MVLFQGWRRPAGGPFRGRRKPPLNLYLLGAGGGGGFIVSWGAVALPETVKGVMPGQGAGSSLPAVLSLQNYHGL